jgi:hypothetical protein
MPIAAPKWRLWTKLYWMRCVPCADNKQDALSLALRAYSGGFSSPAMHPALSDFIGSVATVTVIKRSHFAHSKLRKSYPVGPGQAHTVRAPRAARTLNREKRRFGASMRLRHVMHRL